MEDDRESQADWRRRKVRALENRYRFRRFKTTQGRSSENREEGVRYDEIKEDIDSTHSQIEYKGMK